MAISRGFDSDEQIFDLFAGRNLVSLLRNSCRQDFFVRFLDSLLAPSVCDFDFGRRWSFPDSIDLHLGQAGGVAPREDLGADPYRAGVESADIGRA